MAVIARLTVKTPRLRIAVLLVAARFIAFLPERAQAAFMAVALRWISAGLKFRAEP